MRSLSSPTLTAVAQTITEPRYFLQIDFATVVRLCTNGTTSWNSQTWSDGAFTVSGLSWDSSIVQNLTLNFADGDLAMAALVLNEDIADRPIKLWVFDAEATATADPVLVFDGAGLSASGGSDGSLRISATRLNSRTVDLPRGTYRTALPAELFAPAGTVIQWGNGTITLNPRGALA